MLGSNFNKYMFQSSPARGGGCNGAGCHSAFRQRVRLRFQSSPARGGGCNLVGVYTGLGEQLVSILTRPWGRVQHSELEILPKPPEAFQSSPARGGGCNIGVMCPCTARVKFQSSPARGGGCNLLAKAGALARDHHASILTRPWGRVQRTMGTVDELIRQLVSILTRPWGRVQHLGRARRVASVCTVSILTRPWGRVQHAKHSDFGTQFL